jgi:hypothetical protein
MVALAGDLDLLRPRLLASLAAIFVRSLRKAPARQVRALNLLIGRHDDSPFKVRLSGHH